MNRYTHEDVLIRQNNGALEIHVFFKQGVSFDLPLEFFDDQAETVETDFSGFTASMVFRAQPEPGAALETWTSATDGGIVIASTKTVTLKLAPNRTDDLPETSYADLKIADGTGGVHPNHHLRFVFNKQSEVVVP